MKLPSLLLLLALPTSLSLSFEDERTVHADPASAPMLSSVAPIAPTASHSTHQHLADVSPPVRRLTFTAESLDTTHTWDGRPAPTRTTVGLTPALAFPADAETSLLASFQVHADWDARSDLDVRLVTSSGETVGDVAWHIDYAAVGEDEVSPSSGTRLGVTATVSPTPSGRVTSSPVPLPAWDLEPGDLVSLNLLRDGDSSADTLNGDVHVHLVSITYRAKR